MKATFILIIIFGLMSCSDKQDNDFLDKSLDKKNKDLAMELEKRAIMNPAQFEEPVDRIRRIHKTYKILQEQIEKDNKSVLNKSLSKLDSDLKSLISDYDLGNQIQPDFFPISDKVLDYSEKNAKVNLLYILNETYSALLNSFHTDDYKFDKVNPLIVPDKKEIGLDEFYKARIYLTGIDTGGSSICMIREKRNGRFYNTDTLQSSSGYFRFIEKADKKGKYIVNGQILILDYEKGIPDTFDLKFDYRVK